MLLDSVCWVYHLFYICPIVIVKSLKSSLNSKISAELNSHADTSVVGSNKLVVHNHEHYIDFDGCDSKSRHKHVTTIDAAVVFDKLSWKCPRHVPDMSLGWGHVLKSKGLDWMANNIFCRICSFTCPPLIYPVLSNGISKIMKDWV